MQQAYTHDMKEGEPSLIHRAARIAAWGGGGLALSAAAAAGFANHAEGTTTLGTHEVTVSPTVDQHATVDIDGVGTARIPVAKPFGLGVKINLKNTSGLRQSFEQDALIAANPQAEINNLAEATRNVLLKSVGKGALLGFMTTGSLYVATRKRREEGQRDSIPRGGMLVAGIGIGIMASQIVAPGNFKNDDSTTWIRLADKVPALNAIDSPELQQLEVERGILADTSIETANSVVDGYKAAKQFFSELEERVPSIIPELRQPEEGEIVVLQVSDRHDNILMDPVTRAIGDAAGATIVLDTGDDTSSGSKLEAFSLNSLDKTFEGYEKIVVNGNHDNGSFVGDHLRDKGWNVLEGKPITVRGIRFIGDADPRNSTATYRFSQTGETVAQQSERLAQVACEDKASTLAVHSVSAGRATAEAGCVDLVVGGHLHVQVGPEVTTSPNGHKTTVYTNGTTGGATFAFALGTKIRRDAQVTLITYREGKPIGLQPVTVKTTGEFDVQPFWELPTTQPANPVIEANKQPIQRDRKTQ